MCRKLWRTFRRVTTLTVSSTATSNCAPWFTCVALKSKNWRSSSANHRDGIRHLWFPHADPPFRLMQPPRHHIHIHRRSPGQLPDSHRQPRTHQLERQTDGRSIQTALCQFSSCNSNLTISDYWMCGLVRVNCSAAADISNDISCLVWPHIGVNFYLAARLEPALFKILGFLSSQPPPHFLSHAMPTIKLFSTM